MKKFIKLSLAITLIAFAFTSCKKSSDNTPVSAATSMKLTLNGNVINFNTCIEGDATINGVKQLLIEGNNFTAGKPGAENFEINIVHDPATLKAGQTFPIASSFTQTESASLFYFPNDSDNFATQPANPQGTVTITDVNSSTVKGTFSGKLFAADDLDGATVIYTVINGSFTAKRGN